MQLPLRLGRAWHDHPRVSFGDTTVARIPARNRTPTPFLSQVALSSGSLAGTMAMTWPRPIRSLWTYLPVMRRSRGSNSGSVLSGPWSRLVHLSIFALASCTGRSVFRAIDYSRVAIFRPTPGYFSNRDLLASEEPSRLLELDAE